MNKASKDNLHVKALLNNTLQSLVLIDRECKVISFNTKASDTSHQLLGRQLTTDQPLINYLPQEAIPGFRNAMDRVLKGETVNGTKAFRDLLGKKRWFRYNYTPVPSHNGSVDMVSCSSLDITAEKDKQNEIGKNDHFNELYFDSPAVGVVLTDEEGIIYRVNNIYCTITGYERDELVGKPFTITVPPSEQKKAMADYEKFMRGVETGEEPRIFGKGKKYIDYMVTSILVTDYDDRRFKLTTVRDVSENKRYEAQLKQSLKEKEVMLQEIHHRVKNNMAVITGLLSLQADSIEDATIKKYYRESENRIRSIAMIHEQLYHTDNFAAIEIGSYIEDLARMISMQTHTQANIDIAVDAKNVFLNINSAVPCGLIIHELLTNAYTHAFKGKNDGYISVRFLHIDETYSLIVEDNGVGISKESLENSERSQLGLNLIRGLTRQLDGSIKFTKGKGTKITLKFKNQ